VNEEPENHPGWHIDGGACPDCGKPTITEANRGWWCSNGECRLRKAECDIEEADAYRPEHALPPVSKAINEADNELVRLRELNAELLRRLSAIVSASDSKEAQGGEMWWSEAVYPHVEAAKPVLAKASS